MATAEDILSELRSLASRDGVAGMARFGIATEDALGVPHSKLRPLAKRLGRDHNLARALWATGVREACLLAGMVEEPSKVTRAQMERWARAFRSWDVVDGVCMDAFQPSPHAYAKALEWSGRDEEFVKRAGFVLMARIAFREEDRTRPELLTFLAAIEREAHDPRNFVKKAVSWALREIGKRRADLRGDASRLAVRLSESDDAARRWVGRDALRDLTPRPASRGHARTRRTNGARTG